MNSPWGRLQVSDAHVHFFSYGFFSGMAGQMIDHPGGGVEAVGRITGWRMPPENPSFLADEWAAELDRHGVARAVMIASLPGDEVSVAAAVARHPDRFHGYFMVNPLAMDAASRVAAGLTQGLKGICLFPAMHRYSIADERIRPILRLAAGRPGTVIFVHAGVLTVGIRKKLGLASPFDMRYSNPIDLHPVALEYPQLSFVVPHFGAGYLREALMLCDLCPNVSLDTSSSNSWIRYLLPDTDLRHVFRRALDVVGPKRLLFGSDSSFFPRGWHAQVFEAQSQALYELGIGAEDAARIFGGNLEALLKARTAAEP
jgi:uncharacterized protein